MSSSRLGEGMMVSLRRAVDYSTVVYATIGATMIRLVRGRAAADHFIRRATRDGGRSGVTRDHIDHLLVGRVDDHELVVEPRIVIRLQRGHSRSDLGRYRLNGDIAGDHGADRGFEVRRRGLVAGLLAEVFPDCLLYTSPRPRDRQRA